MVDVTIVGGGIAGLSAAYELSRRRVSFVLLEQAPKPGGVILSEQVEGFTIDGQPGLAGTSFPASVADVRRFKDVLQPRVVGSKLVYIGSGDTVRGVNDVGLRNLLLRRAGGEPVQTLDCIRAIGECEQTNVGARGDA